jgi:cell wall-associated NlpC family hydrolase
MPPPCTCPSNSGGKKLAAGGLVVVALFAAGHAKPGHAAKPAAAVVADAARPADSDRGAVAVAWARRQIGVAYLWGGTGRGGFDCSGLVYEAWRHAGVSIPRTTFKQWPALRHISRSQLRPGDLIFYAGSDGTQANPGHVVMYIGGGWVIQAFETGTNVMLTRLADVNAGPLTGYARPGGA